MCRECEVDDVVDIGWLDPESDVVCEWFFEEELDVDESGFSEDDEVPNCPEPARLALRMRMVQAHLCAAHATSEQQALSAGLGELLEHIGLQDDASFVELTPEDTDSCDECSHPATCAHVVFYEQCYCEEHAKEAGATLPPAP